MSAEMLLLSKSIKVLFYLILFIADLFLWFIIWRELKERDRIFRASVLVLKTAVTALFLFLLFRIVLYTGEFADPANAFRQIQMGTMAALLVAASTACVAVTILKWLISILRGRKPGTPGIANTLIFILLTLLVVDGYFRQRLDIRTVRQTVTVAGLDPALDGMKIALIADIHISSFHDSYDRLERAMQSVSDENPDLILNTGDFITFGWQESGKSDTILRKAKALAGAFAVEGNHDDGTYYPGFDVSYGAECRMMVEQYIESSGYTLLRDSAAVISCRGKNVAIAGVTTHGHRLDMTYGNFEKVLAPLPDSLFTILLIHDPAGWLISSVAGRLPDLTVAGHTHGFQAGLPGRGWSPSSLIHEQWRGLYEFRGSHLFVSTGLGTMGMAARFFMPPEIVILTITTD
jgi:predicted MPP superfamily phosphohydrolase